MTALALTDNFITTTPPDDAVIRMWLHGRSPHTQRAYAGDIDKLRTFVAAPLAAITLQQLQDFSDSLDAADASKRRTLSAIKSLFTFGHRLGYLPFNTAHALLIPAKSEGVLAERILTVEQVQKMIESEPDPRKNAVLVVLYYSGVRVEELCSLRWTDCQQRESGGQITVMGKGRKIRVIALTDRPWTALQSLPRSSDRVVNRSTTSVWRIVHAAAKRAGLPASTHWLRHACASHALDAGCPLATVKETLGHADIRTTSRYLHARPNQSAGMWLKV